MECQEQLGLRSFGKPAAAELKGALLVQAIENDRLTPSPQRVPQTPPRAGSLLDVLADRRDICPEPPHGAERRPERIRQTEGTGVATRPRRPPPPSPLCASPRRAPGSIPNPAPPNLGRDGIRPNACRPFLLEGQGSLVRHDQRSTLGDEDLTETCPGTCWRLAASRTSWRNPILPACYMEKQRD